MSVLLPVGSMPHAAACDVASLQLAPESGATTAGWRSSRPRVRRTEVVLLPPQPDPEDDDGGVNVDKWTCQPEDRRRYAVRVTDAGDSDAVRTFVTSRKGKGLYGHSFVLPSAQVRSWRATTLDFAKRVQANTAVSYQKKAQVAALDDLYALLGVCKELPPNVDEVMRNSLEGRIRSAYGEGREPAWGLNELLEEQRALLNFTTSFVDRLRRKPATLLDLCVDVMTLAASVHRPDEDTFTRIQALLFLGTTLIEEEANPAVVATFVRVVTFHACVFKLATPPAGLSLRRLVSRLVTAVAVDADGVASLFDHFAAMAKELSRPAGPSGPHVNLQPYRSLTWTYQLLAVNEDFCLLLNAGELPHRVVELAPDLAALLLHEEAAVWEATAYLVTHATVPGLFAAVIRSDLWSPDCRLNELRLRSIFARLLQARRACDGEWQALGAGSGAARKDSEGVRLWVVNFNALMTELSSRNIAHYLVGHIDEMVEAGLGDAVRFRSYLADPELGLTFLSTPRTPLRVVVSNALWKAYPIAAGMIAPQECVAAIPPPSSRIIAPPASGTATMDDDSVEPLDAGSAFDPAGDVMGAFAMSLANPVHSRTVLQEQLAEMMRLVRESPRLATCIISRFGDFAAGCDPAGRLTSVEDWLRDTLTPTFREVRATILALFPHRRDAIVASAGCDPHTFNRVGLERVGNTHLVQGASTEATLRAIESEMVSAGSELRAAVWDFVPVHLSFGGGSAGQASGPNLGPDVAAEIKGMLSDLTVRLQHTEVRTALAPRILSLAHFMKAMLHFSYPHMKARLRKSVRTLERGVRLMRRGVEFAEEQGAAPYWRSTPIRHIAAAELSSVTEKELATLSFIDPASGDVRPDRLLENVDALPAFLSGVVAGLGRDAASSEALVVALGSALETHVVYHISQALSMACLREIKKIIISAADGAQVTDVSTKFQAVTDRNLDRIMFPLSEFANFFNTRNGATLARAQPDATRLADLEPAQLKSLNERTMLRYRDAFSAMDVPVTFLLANQLLAVQLISRVVPGDALVRLGTGQGKSILLALSAVAECRSGRDKVFVLTSYDHLARRDHAFASRLFQVDGLASCVLTDDDSSLSGFATAKVVFANVMAIDSHVRAIFMKLYAGEVATESEAAFLSVVYGLQPSLSTAGSGGFSVLLDEFDLLMTDLENNQPFFTELPSAIMKRDDVARFSKFSPPGLALERPRALVRTAAIDEAAGTMHSYLSGTYLYRDGGGDPYYFMLPSVFRVGQFMAPAVRVVGVSGSTSADGSALHGRDAVAPFFEMPYSQDPTLYETRILPAELDNTSPLSGGSAAQLDGGSGIWCHRREIIGGGSAGGGAGLVSEAQVERYCAAVCADIAAVQAVGTTEAGAVAQRRPVLVFVPALLAYINRDGKRVAVRDRLHQVIRENGAVAEMSLVVTPINRDPTDAEIQRIGQAGYVTLSDIKLGRGVDIRVSIDIPGGLHVIVATEVLHRRLLKQMIGRTGRLGREGSYSIIVMDRIISPHGQKPEEAWTGALHLVSALGAYYLLDTQHTQTGESRREWVCKWLLFLLRCRGKSGLGAKCIDRTLLAELIPATATAGSVGATAMRARLSKMLGGSPL